MRESFLEIARCVVVVVLCGLVAGVPSRAEEVSEEEMQGLDEQVQEIKSDVLRIAAELTHLEEQLLYPSGTQLAVFVALAENERLELDSVQLQLDGAPVARHVYSFKELEALRKGGVQRIYTGNVATGEHRLEVTVVGKLPGGAAASSTEQFPFSKQAEPKVVGITLAGAEGGATGIRLGAW